MLSTSSLSNSLTLSSKLTYSFFFLSPTSFSSSLSSAINTQTFNFPLTLPNNSRFTQLLSRNPKNFILKSCSDSESEAEVSKTVEEDEWLSKLADKKKPLYAHSLPCIEAWIKSLGFAQSKEDIAVWFIEKPEWHAQLSLDITEIHIRYMKSGPGNLEKDMERRFSYALSREDIENAVLGGP